ncbi:hypothetical protein GCM10009625_07800 [Brachybacterium fresconis]
MLTSATVTSNPAMARTWAMPPPMYPAPTMVTVEMVMENSFVRAVRRRGGGACAADCPEDPRSEHAALLILR